MGHRRGGGGWDLIIYSQKINMNIGHGSECTCTAALCFQTIQSEIYASKVVIINHTVQTKSRNKLRGRTTTPHPINFIAQLARSPKCHRSTETEKHV